MPQVILKPRKARPFYGRHPWVLDSAVDRVENSPADGDMVDLLSDKGKFIARGIYIQGRAQVEPGRGAAPERARGDLQPETGRDERRAGGGSGGEEVLPGE